MGHLAAPPRLMQWYDPHRTPGSGTFDHHRYWNWNGTRLVHVVEIVPRRESHGVQSPNFYSCVILCHCTLAAALYFEQSSCDELMEFKPIQTRAQPEESLKHNHRQVWLCFNDSSGCALV